ncbi:hypothetical protein P8S55_09065 [Halomonas sp. M1]|uniref:DUF6602 domain-containing protein n=1 Tax=Halomonas sp. M1 TaxID=3035470 RepID=UPI002484EC92|nr:DUF6602 domain-containing protein [Halomonas sp. M1]WFE69942.1 hypothetical protein P8S55_09065 [Halomonas sp. M1]
MFQSILDARIRDLWNLYEATGELKHPGEKGLLREMFVKRVLESLLPPHFGVGTGIVVDKWRRQSPQVDLIIFDRRRLPPILEENGHGIYPMDAVLRVIEVKSTLDKDGLKQLGRLSNSLSPSNPDGLKMATEGNLENGRSYYPFASLFAYKSTLSNIVESKKGIPDLVGATCPVCVITKGVDAVPNVGIEQNMRLFLTMLLAAIEASASSRKEFSISEWMFG